MRRSRRLDQRVLFHLRLRRRVRAAEEWLLPHHQLAVAHDHFRRTIAVVAALGLGLFFPGLVVANVPPSRWPEFLIVAAASAMLCLGTLLGPMRSSWARIAGGLTIAGTLAG